LELRFFVIDDARGVGRRNLLQIVLSSAANGPAAS
jgi:hypothetical protein